MSWDEKGAVPSPTSESSAADGSPDTIDRPPADPPSSQPRCKLSPPRPRTARRTAPAGRRCRVLSSTDTGRDRLHVTPTQRARRRDRGEISARSRQPVGQATVGHAGGEDVLEAMSKSCTSFAASATKKPNVVEMTAARSRSMTDERRQQRQSVKASVRLRYPPPPCRLITSPGGSAGRHVQEAITGGPELERRYRTGMPDQCDHRHPAGQAIENDKRRHSRPRHLVRYRSRRSARGALSHRWTDACSLRHALAAFGMYGLEVEDDLGGGPTVNA